MKAPSSYLENIGCHGCLQQFVGSADSARYHGWKVGWRPEMPSWCPACGGSEKRRRLQQLADALNEITEPLF